MCFRRVASTVSVHFCVVVMLAHNADSRSTCALRLVLVDELAMRQVVLTSCGVQNEAEDMKNQAEEEAAQRELCEFQLEKLRMQVLGMRTSA